MQNGIVKWFSDQRGFGFIESLGKDYFAHYKEIQATGFKSLQEGDKVSFEPSITPKGPMATMITKIMPD